MKIRIKCSDKYEAQKLSSLIFIKDSKETFITEIVNIYENEVVVSLRDKSAHSIVMKDSSHVEIFADFLQSVLENRHTIKDIITENEEVEIIKE